jgi:hypothetical protein
MVFALTFSRQTFIKLKPMKRILPVLLLSVILGACGSSKSYLERTDEDKALQDAVKKLNKNASDDEARTAVPILYKSILKTHLGRIKSYESGADISRWDQVIGEYNDLQAAYNTIVNSSPAFKLVTPENYSTQLLEVKEKAAEAYYIAADNYLQKPAREDAKKAYSYFKRTERYIPSYKDAREKMNQAYENAIVDVVINPVQDNSFFFNSGWGSSGYDYSNEYFQRTLVRELAYDNNSNNRNYAARFYADWEARRENIQPDWIVDLRLRNMDLPRPTSNTYRQSRSANVQSGTDTSGKPIYQKVYANLNVTRMSFTARAEMEVMIRDIASSRTISNRSFREDYRWQQETATYSGDSRALTPQDWQMINTNNSTYAPRREEVLNELYRKIYPQVLNNIKYTVEF